MKKFISFVMAAAMVASLVPATAFAKGDVTATARVIDAAELEKGESQVYDRGDGPELHLTLTDVSGQITNDGALPTFDVELTLDNAEFSDYADPSDFTGLVTAYDKDNTQISMGTVGSITYTYTDKAAVGVDYTTTRAMSAAGLLQNESDPAENGDDFMSWAEFDAAVAKADPAKTASEYFDSIKGTYTHVANETRVEQPITGGDGSLAVAVKSKDMGKDFVKYTFTYNPKTLKDDSKIIIDLKTVMTKTTAGTKATVSVDSDAVTVDDLVFATIVGAGISASVRKTVDVAVEEKTELNSRGLTISTAVGNFVNGQRINLRLNNGFEFDKFVSGTDYRVVSVDGREAEIAITNSAVDEIVIAGEDVIIEATTAKSGAVATITVKAVKDSGVAGSFSDTTTVEVAVVVDYIVKLSVDEDEDVPVIYSGVNVNNFGITDDSDHLSLEVTAEESFPGAWSTRQGFTFTLPEGIHVTNVEVNDVDGFVQTDRNGAQTKVDDAELLAAFFDAYQKGDHVTFEFAKRVFDDVNTSLNADKATMTFQLELVADPTFEGDVVLKFDGALVDSQEVTIAKFVKPYTVTAAQNDVIIDYRKTAVNTDIVVTEAEAGLWDKGARFTFTIDRGDVVQFEDTAEYVINDASDLEVKDGIDEKQGEIWFEVKTSSGDEAAVVTITNLELFMQRSIPAGSYDLNIFTNMEGAFLRQGLYAPDTTDCVYGSDAHDRRDEECFVDDVDDYSSTVREAFINVVTSGRDNDNLFTTKVTVPVGEQYILAGEDRIELDAASVAYITADGYTMLPVRAVARALGINTSNVMWSGETRTVTIMYGQRIVTMTIGVKTITINGSSVPSSAAPEIKDGRTFLPLRDLATALGVTDITWDAATRTATLNGGTAATTTAATPAA